MKIDFHKKKETYIHQTMRIILFLLFFTNLYSQFVIIIPSYNNSAYVEKNLASVLEQEGQWRAIYIDDASTDDTFEKAKKIIDHSPKKNQITLIHNERRSGALENLYRAIWTCQDHEIVVTLDGDDWFSHSKVISYLTNVYQDKYIWMTYGSYINYPQGIKGECSQNIPLATLFSDDLRTYRWSTSHLRTFYASLFKKIKLEDLVYQGKCFPMAWDQAIMFPMIEMARDHSLYIDDILYVYNELNPINDSKVNRTLMQRCRKTILSLDPYPPLQNAPFTLTHNEQSFDPDLLIFSYDRPMQLYALLESIERYCMHLNHISVLIRTSAQEYAEAYQKVQSAFPSIKFVKQGDSPFQDFKPLCLSTIESTQSEYIAFAVDDIIIKDNIDFRDCAKQLNQTGAYGFYLRLGNHVNYCYSLNKPQSLPHFISLTPNVMAWQFEQGEGDWGYPNTVDLTVYKKITIENDLRNMRYIHPNSLENAWSARCSLKKMGICYLQSKLVNIPLNLVNLSQNRNMASYTPAQLLEKFNAGLKIDIAPLYQIQNPSAHIEYLPTFIARE